MSIPVFEDVEPLPDCGCEDCARRRLAASTARDTAAPAGSAARAVVAAAAVGTALGGVTVCGVPLAAAATGAAATGAAATSSAATSAAATSAAATAPMTLTRAQILERAETWVSAKVPYSMTSYWKDGYRQDCSGFVSMAWGLNTNAWTGDLAHYAVRVTKAQLQPGDVLLFNDPADPVKGSHVVLFGGWVDDARTEYTGYEQTTPGTRVQSIPYAYWSNSAKYVPYRDKYLAAAGSSAAGSPAPAKSEPAGSGAAFPGRAAFGPGADNASVTRLGTMLVGRGGRGYYRVGPGPEWGQADARATAAFQRAQGWTGADADGLPGPTTWKYLTGHRGRDIGGTTAKKAANGVTATSSPKAAAATAAPAPGAASPPPYPGQGAFRPGRSSADVLALGARLVARGFGTHYRAGPSRTWSEADRRNVEAFQRAQGWSRRDADGRPGPETWRRLFT